MDESLFLSSLDPSIPSSSHINFSLLSTAATPTLFTTHLTTEIARLDSNYTALGNTLKPHPATPPADAMRSAKRVLRFAQLNLSALVALGVERHGSDAFAVIGAALQCTDVLYCKAVIKCMARLDHSQNNSPDAPLLSASVLAEALPDVVFELLHDLLDALLANRADPRRHELKAMRAFATNAPQPRIHRAAPPPTPPPPTTTTTKSRISHWQVHNDDVERGALLGAGAFGSVYRGRWRQTDVAVKELAASGQLDEGQFLSEMQLLCALRPHRHVVTLYAVVAKPRPAIVMELCVGSLSDWLASEAGRRATIFELLRIVDGTARGVAHLHAELVVHGDLAARNVLLTDAGVPKVCDFGFAQSAPAAAPLASARLPIKWMAPELLLGARPSLSSDLYSFGCVVSEVVNRRPPFPTLSNDAAARLVVEEGVRPEPVPPAMGGVALAWLAAAVQACWAAEPPARPSMLELCAQFRLHAAETRTSAADTPAPSDRSESLAYDSLHSDTAYSLIDSEMLLPATPRRESTRVLLTSSAGNDVLDTAEKRLFFLDFVASQRVPADVVFMWRVALYRKLADADVAGRLAEMRSIVLGPLRDVFLLDEIVAEIEAALLADAPPRADVFERACQFLAAGQSRQLPNVALESAFAAAALAAMSGTEFVLSSQLLDKFQSESDLLGLVGKAGAAASDWQVLRHADDVIVCSRWDERTQVFGARCTTLIRRDAPSVVRYVSSMHNRAEWDTSFIDGRVVTELGPRCAIWWAAFRVPGLAGSFLKKRDTLQMRLVVERDANTTLLLVRSIPEYRSSSRKVAGFERTELDVSGFIVTYKPELQMTMVTYIVLLNKATVGKYLLRQFALQRAELLTNIRSILQLANGDDKLQTAWFAAAAHGQLPALKDALKKLGPTALVLRDRASRLALHCAASAGHTDAVRWLAAHKRAPSIDVLDQHGWSALTCAAAAGCVDTCLALLELGADATVCTTSKATPLHYAARVPVWSGAVQTLLARLIGGSPHALAARDSSGATPLHLACFKGCADVVAFLLDRGAGLHAVDERGDGALHYAARGNQFDTLELLLLRGADPRLCNASGQTPHDAAVDASAKQTILDKLAAQQK